MDDFTLAKVAITLRRDVSECRMNNPLERRYIATERDGYKRMTR